MKRCVFLAVMFAALLPYCSQAVVKHTETVVPRRLVALYDSNWESSPRTTFINRFLEMPANHLGYDVQYYDVRATLPVLDEDVAGIIIWFNPGTIVPAPQIYLNWLENAVAHGKKLIVIENPGLGDAPRKDSSITERWNRILSHIGMQDDMGWSGITYHAEITYADKRMIGFEHPLKSPYPAISMFHATARGTSHLRMRLADSGRDESYDMVVTGPNGGFIAEGYAIFADDDNKDNGLHSWIINPFLFLEQSLNAGLVPIPDNTTLDGKRIFYSHIDGDGWNNVSEIEKYRDERLLASEVIYREILKPYSDFAFNVALVTADVDPKCFAVPGSEQVAREIFKLPNVEPSSHTYSHPLYWAFFENYTPEKERPLLKNYPVKTDEKFSAFSALRHSLGEAKEAEPVQDSWLATQKKSGQAQGTGKELKRGTHDKSEQEMLKEYNNIARSYACSPFNLEQEIMGAVETVKRLSPPDKKVRLVQWPGDTSPIEAAMAMARKAGLLNINGGDSRFDNEYPSYSYVAPIGVKVNKELQVYASNSNEETYTNDWKSRFYGFRYLTATVSNTEHPMRVSPFNIYFHMFSGEKQASLNAIKENLDFARSQDVIPITASDYSEIAEGFFTARIVSDGAMAWRIHGRGALQTVRFDNPSGLGVDFGASQGVLGQYAYQNSLYVSLDPETDEAHVVLHKANVQAIERPYLLQSRWRVHGLRKENSSIAFKAEGFGDGVMSWQARPDTLYIIKVEQVASSPEMRVRADEKGVVRFTLKARDSLAPLDVSINTSY